jgi:hypothetical protein
VVYQPKEQDPHETERRSKQTRENATNKRDVRPNPRAEPEHDEAPAVTPIVKADDA